MNIIAIYLLISTKVFIKYTDKSYMEVIMTAKLILDFITICFAVAVGYIVAILYIYTLGDSDDE